ncbi:MAG: OmpA family protein [Pseudomonadota bacterium]
MRAYRLVKASAFIAAALAALAAADASVTLVEENSTVLVRDALMSSGLYWATVETDGLRVTVGGVAPSEADRFDAVRAAGTVVDAGRVVDAMATRAAAALASPRFSAELLRNGQGLSIIGLVPASTDRAALIERLQSGMERPVTDLLESADYPAPQGWEDALSFALTAAETLPRSKVSVDAGRVDVTAITDSADERTDLEKQLRRAAPPALDLSLDIAAPRPVVSPYILRFVIDDAGARFDACTADTDAARRRILDAAHAAGLLSGAHCTIGMGVPSGRWADAASAAITSLATIGAGSVTFSDADIALMASEKTDPRLFDRVVGELENNLPDFFVLQAILPDVPDSANGPVEFVATLSPEGQVQLRGRLPDAKMRDVTESFSHAKFGSSNVYMAARLSPDLPDSWSIKVLAGLQALDHLENGALTVTTDRLRLSGRSHNENTRDLVSRLIADKLGPSADVAIDISYQPEPVPQDAPPTPDECQAELTDLMSVAKISFEPSSATIDEASVATMDDIAEILGACGDLKLEVQGHTDSQGREEMNLALSQSRAESVLNELRARKVPTKNFLAKGYGEAAPVEDNDTEEGREANRRIEFHLIKPNPSTTDTKTTLETIAENSDTGTATGVEE